VEEIADRLGILDVLARYAHALDEKEWAVLTEVFTAGATIDLTSSGGSGAAGLATERDRVAAAGVELLAAGQAPWSADHVAIAPGDPEPGRVLQAVDADPVDAKPGAGLKSGELFLRLRR
jgi:hypothetical protein